MLTRPRTCNTSLMPTSSRQGGLHDFLGLPTYNTLLHETTVRRAKNRTWYFIPRIDTKMGGQKHAKPHIRQPPLVVFVCSHKQFKRCGSANSIVGNRSAGTRRSCCTAKLRQTSVSHTSSGWPLPLDSKADCVKRRLLRKRSVVLPSGEGVAPARVYCTSQRRTRSRAVN